MARSEFGGASRLQDNVRTVTSSFCAGEAATIFPNAVLCYAGTLPERKAGESSAERKDEWWGGFSRVCAETGEVVPGILL